MRRLIFIFIVLLAVLAGCERFDESVMKPQSAPEGEKVTISFKVAIPNDGEETKAMGVTPTIDPDGFYIAVFGGSGYFNEWVQATVQQASTNYPSNSTVYNLTASFQVSDSRLRLHFIANCPEAFRMTPPISGSLDTEENVMSQIRSQRTDTYNDGYWQKLILPNGIRANKNENEVYVPTPETVAQFPDPIVLVRNFARVYLRNITPMVGTQGENVHQLVKIYNFGLAYAPAEGVIAPILSAPYTSNNVGAPITVSDDDNTTPLYYENFFINYQNYPLSSLTADPFNYNGYSPSNQSYDYYPAAGHTDAAGNIGRGAPIETDLQPWDDDNPENNVLYVYERTIPTTGRRATRLIIQAERIDQNGVSDGKKFYALDIVNDKGVSVPLLRNQSYTVHLINIEAGTGETDISNAAQATSASVTGNPDFQNLINISDGKSSIGTSFTEQFYVKPQEDFVMFRYIPTNVQGEGGYSANQEVNDLVSISVGTVNTDTGVFTELTPSQASSQGILTFKTDGDNYKVWIDKRDGSVVRYVRSHNAWVEATLAQISNPQIEKWGMIKYELYDTNLDEGYYNEERTQAIHVSGSFNNRELSRNVIIKTSPRQQLIVTCEQKYVAQSSGQQEVLKIKIPTGLSRSVFPIDFTIEADAYSLTPDGDVLPVAYGTSTIGNDSGPAYYFVKTLTQAEYDGLSTVENNTWKVFECHFKTTVAQNASTIYVKNRFFTDTEADDEFYNYQQRLFTWSNTTNNLNSVTRNSNITVSFDLDNVHSSGTKVWWDPTNYLEQSNSVEEAHNKGLSTNNRVLPPTMTVTLQGFTPQYKEDGVTPVTSALEYVSGNTYLYQVGSSSPANIDPTNLTIALTATGRAGTEGKVTLSTDNLTEAPLLYAKNTKTVLINGLYSFSNLSFGTSPLPLGKDKTTNFSFRYQQDHIVPITIRLDGLALNGTDARMTDNGNGTYTFTPTDVNTRNYSISLKSTTRFSSGTVTLSQDDYTPATATVSRATSFTISAGTLRAGTKRPSSYSTYVYLYYTDTYSDNYYISSNRYSTRFTTNNNYSSRDEITIDLTKYGDTVEDGIVYFYYTGNDASNGSGAHYSSAPLTALFDAVDAGQSYTINFKGSLSVTFQYSSFNNNSSVTSNGATLAFSSRTYSNGYLTLANNSTATVTAPTGYHIGSVDFRYYRYGGGYVGYTYYTPNSVSSSPSGTYSGSTTSRDASWTAGAVSTSTVFTFTKQNNVDTRLVSMAITFIED